MTEISSFSSLSPVQGLARQYLQKAVEPEQAECDSRDILDEGFSRIAGSSGISEQERALADLGRAMKSSIGERYPASMAMLSLMSHMAASSMIPSPVGAAIGKECLAVVNDTARYFNGESAGAEVLSTGFAVISESPGSSEQERMLADFGKDVAQTPLSLKDRAQASREVMNELTVPHDALRGPQFSDLALRAAMKMQHSQDARHVLDSAFRAIGKNPETDDRDRALARFGYDFASATGDSYAAACGKLMVMDAIASSMAGTAGAVYGALSLGIIDNALDDQPDLQKDMLDHAFREITESPDATEREKALAREGLSAGSESGDGPGAAQKFLIMKQIAGPEPAADTQSAGGAGNDLAMDDDFLSLGGLRISRQKD